MNKDVSKYNDFDRFLGREMTDEEIRDFKQKLERDREFSREFEEYKALRGSVKELEKEQFRNQLLERGRNIILQEGGNAEHEPDDAKVKSLWGRKYFRWGAVAACLIVLLLPVSMYFYTSLIFPNQVYNRYYSPYENVIAPTVRGEEEQTTIQKSLQSYTAKNYEQAITDLRQLIDDHPKWKMDVGLFLGISYLETSQVDRAIPIFREIIQAEKEFEDQARWYLAMSYLKKHKTEEAKNQLQLLAGDPESSYQKKAKEVLEQF